MSWTLFGWAVLALANQPAYTQAAPDLSKDPRLQQTVDVHMKRALLPELTKYLRTHTDQRFLLATDVEPLMVCVFARNQPLWLVMKDVAQVLGCEWKDVGSGWRLSMPKQDSAMLAAYLVRENAALRNDIYLRAKALASLSSTKPWSEIGRSGGESGTSNRDDEPADIWAARVIHDPAYYIAGLMFSRAPILGRDGGKLDCPFDFTQSFLPTAYKLVAPITPEIANTFQCGTADSAAELAGKQILVRNLKWAGTFQAVLVDGESRQAEKPHNLVRYPRPLGDLAKSEPGKYLLDWETTLDSSNEPLLKTKVGKVEPPPSEFNGGGRGIEDYLEALSDAVDVPIVCDGFRLPVQSKDLDKDLPTLKSWLATLRDSERCFVKLDDKSVMVRHGGFWDLRLWEPPEDAVRTLESIKNPGLDDYATFVVNQLKLSTMTELSIPLFSSRQIPLTRFNSKPIRDSYLALAAYGQMNEQQRVHVLSGGSVDTHRNVEDSVRTRYDVTFVNDKRGRPVAFIDEIHTGRQVGNDFFLTMSALFGPLYGGRATPLERRLMECTVWPSRYLHLWHESPDDNPDFVKAFGAVDIRFAYYLTLQDPSESQARIAVGEPRRLTGTFHFFASVSDSEGVRNDIVIPDTSNTTGGRQ